MIRFGVIMQWLAQSKEGLLCFDFLRCRGQAGCRSECQSELLVV